PGSEHRPTRDPGGRAVADSTRSRGDSAAECGSAADRVAERPTSLSHPRPRERGYAAPECRSRDRVDVVEVHDAVGGYGVVLDREYQLRDETTAGPRECRHDNRADPIRDRIPGQHEDRAITPGRRGEPDLTPLHRPNPTSLRQDPSRRSYSASAQR